MFNLIEPGHVLRFATDPRAIISPEANDKPDNTLETLWPTTSNLGNVQVISHPSGSVGDVAAEVAKNLRGASNNSRSLSYSAAGRAFTPSNRVVGSTICDFVGYTDGKSNYIATSNAAFSKDFSGCLFVCYSIKGQRRVAHAASSDVLAYDCKQAFLNTIRAKHAVLHGWFRPFQVAADLGTKINEYAHISNYVNNNINNLTTFGVITAAGIPYSINAFKPYHMGPMVGGPMLGKLRQPGAIMKGNDWVVTSVSAKQMSQNWNV
jgi:hypothetical protein